MEFVNEFTVPTDIDNTWKTLLDLENVAPCLPGATLEEVDGDVYTGRVNVKVGPMTMSYRGTAELVDVNEEARSVRIDAKGRETRGAGTASADVLARLAETDAGTLVRVSTDLTMTGKAAQFGQGVMGEVGTKIIGQFAERLETLVLSGDAADDATQAAPAATGPRKIAPDPSRADDALNLMEVAGAATLKRVVPLVAGLAFAAAVIWLVYRSRGSSSRTLVR